MDKTRSVYSPLAWLTGSTTKSVYRQACKQYSLVYFGNVDQHADEHEMVRGVTLSPTHRDTHYCVGTVNGRDVILLYRTDTIRFPAKPTKTFHWHILEIDLSNVSLPHVFLDAHHRDETFYAQLFAKFVRLTKAHASLFDGYDSRFVQHYTAYSPPDVLDSLPNLISAPIAAELSSRYGQYDYEFFQDRLLVYALERPASRQLIEHMLRAGLWLAAELEKDAPREARDIMLPPTSA